VARSPLTHLRFPLTLLYSMLADLVVIFHFAFVVFVLAGGFLVLRRPWLMYLHLPAALWGAFIEFSGGICPLTPLENSLRERAGMAGYRGGFVEHYILPTLYPSGLTRNLQLILGALVVGINFAVYLALAARLRKRPMQSPASG
jgi:Protein of Unknown function (DUF2784)